MGTLQRNMPKFSTSTSTQMILGEAKLKPPLVTRIILHGPCPSVTTEAHKYRAIFCNCRIQQFLCFELHGGKGWLVVRRSLHKTCKSSPLMEKGFFPSGKKLVLATDFSDSEVIPRLNFSWLFFFFLLKVWTFQINFRELCMVKVFYHKDQLVPAMSIFVLNAVFCQALKNEVFDRCCYFSIYG